ncbi:MAG: CCA tRNA nucleotidyltransferase, partial [Sphingomonas sp.]
ADRKRLASALHDDLEPPRPLAYRLGTDLALDRWLLHADQPLEGAIVIRDWPVPRLPLTGGAIVARGIAKGPDVARLLRAIEARWIAEEFPGAARVDQLADEIVAGWLRSSR